MLIPMLRCLDGSSEAGNAFLNTLIIPSGFDPFSMVFSGRNLPVLFQAANLCFPWTCHNFLYFLGISIRRWISLAWHGEHWEFDDWMDDTWMDWIG
jgi:hypothetical protein